MDYKRLADLLFPNTCSVEEIEKKYPPRALPLGAEVTRIAPSPTGFFHLGNFFSALIDFQIAHSSNGIFYFRCEDTDKKREVQGADRLALQMLKEMQVYPDEGWLLEGSVGEYGPYKQSERVEIYKAYAKKLVSEGKAFPCFCKKPEGIGEVKEERKKRFNQNFANEEYDICRNLNLKEIEEKILHGEKFALRLKTNGKNGERTSFVDVQKGKIEMQANTKDVILIKEDGIPPYAFAHAVDDHLMKTTLVVRGEEWLSSTPAHLEIFDALGFNPPKYFHTPLISTLNENGGKEKLSKRKHPFMNMAYFIEKGYPADAIKEYVLNLISSSFEPWRRENPTAPLGEFKITAGDITAVMPVFDNIKLKDVSKNYIARLTAREVYCQVLKWADRFDKKFAKYLREKQDYCLKVFNIDREGPKPRKDIYSWSMIEDNFCYMFHKPVIENIENKEKFKKFIYAYKQQFVFTDNKDEWFSLVKKVAQESGYAIDNKAYKLNPEQYEGNVASACEHIRLAITGKKEAPDLFTLISILGEDEVRERLSFALTI